MVFEARPGALIGDYVLTRRLGSGGFGEVWQGQSLAGEAVAVKLLTGRFSEADASRVHAQIELLAASVAESRHIVGVIGGGSDPTPYVVMEYISGTDVARELARRKAPFSIQEALVIVRGVAEALAVLEKTGIIHRDIKPANVMIDNDGVVKLADFGVAKIVGLNQGGTSEISLSTPYAAPEVWDGETSAQSDFYAFGALIYEVLVGRTPFAGTHAELYRLHAGGEPDITSLPPETPPALARLISECLAKLPAARPENAARVLELVATAEDEFTRRIFMAPRAPQKAEPQQFGPWRRIAPHPQREWTFLCVHETTAEPATVEVHFTDELSYGEMLNRAVTVNGRLWPLGAERLRGASRLVLAPNESWNSPTPAGRFQFWVAREEQTPPATRDTIALPALRDAAFALNALLQAARQEGLALAIMPQAAFLRADGLVHVPRPGLPPFAADSGDRAALAFFRSLPLDNAARAAALAATDLVDLASGDDAQATIMAPRPGMLAGPGNQPPGLPGIAPTPLAPESEYLRAVSAGSPPPAPAERDDATVFARPQPIEPAEDATILTGPHPAGPPADATILTGPRPDTPREDATILTGPRSDTPRDDATILTGHHRVEPEPGAETTTFDRAAVIIPAAPPPPPPPLPPPSATAWPPAQSAASGSALTRKPVLIAAGGIAAIAAVALAFVAFAGGGGSSKTTKDLAAANATPAPGALKDFQTPTVVPPTQVPPTPPPADQPPPSLPAGDVPAPPPAPAPVPAAAPNAPPPAPAPQPTARPAPQPSAPPPPPAPAPPPPPPPTAKPAAPTSVTINRVFNPGSTAMQTLTTIDFIGNDQMQINVVYKNTGNVALGYACEGGYTPSAVYYTLGDNTVTQASDTYCRHHYGEQQQVDPGKTVSDWAIIKRAPSGRTFSITYYGRTLGGITLP